MKLKTVRPLKLLILFDMRGKKITNRIIVRKGTNQILSLKDVAHRWAPISGKRIH